MSFFAKLSYRRDQRRRPPNLTHKWKHRIRLEALEDRNLLSTLVVTNTSDTGVAGDGSLRGEILAAKNGDKIRFAENLEGQTITLTKGELLLNKNLTIEAGKGEDDDKKDSGDET